MIKGVASLINLNHGRINAQKVEAIREACRETYDGHLDKEFPLVVWQTGSGTQTNMNVNEVVAHRASEIIGQSCISKLNIHPNDDVNLGQVS